MRRTYISAYGVAFRDYKKLKEIVTGFDDFPLGIEYATWWRDPDFYDLLDAQIEELRGVPATIHSPFREICTEPGSEEEAETNALFARAGKYYSAFHAASMVIHTHEGAVPEERREAARARSAEVLIGFHERLFGPDVRLTVENVGYPGKGNVLFDQEEFTRLFDRLPGEIGCLIDTGHAMLNGWDIPLLIRTLGPRIRGYHMNNNDGLHDAHYPCYDPEGFYSAARMDGIVEAIAEHSPDADIIIEYAPDGRFTKESLYADVRRIERILAGK